MGEEEKIWCTKEPCGKCGSNEVKLRGGMHDHAVPFRCLQAIEKQAKGLPACEITKCHGCGRTRIVHAGEWLSSF